MGRTLTTFTQLVRQEIESLRRYRRALRQEDQQALDALFAAARCHSSAGAYLARETPFEIMLLSMLVDVFSRRLRKGLRIDTMPTRLSAAPVEPR